MFGGMDECSEVLAANAAFYRAFESLELSQMEEVWSRAPSIKCIHPGWPLLVGWGPVMESWRRIFANTIAMRFLLTNVHIEVVGDLASVVLVENLESETRAETARGRMQATNLFQRHEGRWRLVHHHASPIDPQLADVTSEQMH